MDAVRVLAWVGVLVLSAAIYVGGIAMIGLAIIFLARACAG